MWMVDPALLCNRHLLGEHGELHKFRPSFEKHFSIAGRVRPVAQIEPGSMGSRHDELAAEMLRRGMNHASPYAMPELSYLPASDRAVVVDRERSLTDLYSRCGACRTRGQR